MPQYLLKWIQREDPSTPDWMISWFRRLLKGPESNSLPRRSAGSQESSSSTPASRRSAPSFTPSSSSPPLPRNSAARQSRRFDVCICHSAMDSPDAQCLASHLEAGPHGFRCFLPLRDSAPGGAIPMELCEAVRSSHCWALLITPAFLADPWCRYQMNQALAEAPVSNRIIPLLLRTSRSDYPAELRFFYYIDLNRDAERGYARVYRTVRDYLAELCRSAVGGDLILGVASQGNLGCLGSTLTNPGFSATPPSSARELLDLGVF